LIGCFGAVFERRSDDADCVQRVGVEVAHHLVSDRIVGEDGSAARLWTRGERWVVERTIAWLHQRRLLVRYERRHDIHEAFLSFACCLICWQRLAQLG
jgi:hypothetical protein